MRRIVLLISVITCYFFNTLTAQVAPAIEWQKCYGGSSHEQPHAVHQTNDGGFIVAGYTSSNDIDVSGNHGEKDFWIVKLDAIGNLIWQTALGGSYLDEAKSIVQTSDGGFIVAGETQSDDGNVSVNYGYGDFWIVKLNANGILSWEKSFGGSIDDIPQSILQTPDGGFVVAGYTSSNDTDVTGNHGSYDYWVIRVDSIGELLWQKTYGGTEEDYAYSIQATSDGGYVVAGQTRSNDGDVTGNHGLGDYWIIKIDADGNMLWQKSLGGSDEEIVCAVEQTYDGGYIVAGGTHSIDGDVSGNHVDIFLAWDYWVVKLDSTANIEWQRCLGGYEYDEARGMQKISDGYILNGLIIPQNTDEGDITGAHGEDDAWVVKLDLSGSLVWERALGGSSYDFGQAIAQTSDGGFIVASVSQSDNGDVTGNFNLTQNYWIAKLTCEVAQPFYADADSDGFGNINDTLLACSAPTGYVINYSDCNDSNSFVHPGAMEILNNGIDDDCDGTTDECSVNFMLIADTLIPHHYWLISNVTAVPPIIYLWSWGDGTTDTAAYPGHQYDSAGFYNICLFIVDSTGCSDSSCVGYDLQKSEEMLTIITVDVVDSIPDIATGITSTNVLQSFSVYPNPASSTVFVNYSLSSPATVNIELYDVLGNKLQEMLNDVDAREHHIVIDTREFSNGVYYLKIRAGEQIVSEKIVVID